MTEKLKNSAIKKYCKSQTLDNQEKERNKGQKFCPGRIVIIAILAAMLLPALGSVKAQGKHASCSNNQKQIGLMIHRYVTDYNDWLPATQRGSASTETGYTIQNLLSMLNLNIATYGAVGSNKNAVQLWTCPSSKKTWYDVKGSSNSDWRGNYCVNAGSVGLYQTSSFARKLSQVNRYKRASLLPAFTDSDVEQARATSISPRLNWTCGSHWWSYSFNTQYGSVGYIHNKHANFLMLDGHVQRIKEPGTVAQLTAQVYISGWNYAENIK